MPLTEIKRVSSTEDILQTLGYKKGEDDILEIVEDEAKIIRKIYQLFLEGQAVRMIADHLTNQGIPTPMGKEKWRVSTIMSILQNERVQGDITCIISKK